MLNDKKAALELTMGTVVIVVLSVSMLILGMILIRSIMCSGLTISEDISAGVKNELKSLFSTSNVPVKCMGEGSQEIKLATGGRRKIICLIKTEENAEYELKITNIQSLKGASSQVINAPVSSGGWVLSKDWTGTVAPGPEKEADVLLLDIPKSAPTTTIRLTIQATNKDSSSTETITSTFDVVSTGFIKGSIC